MKRLTVRTSPKGALTGARLYEGPPPGRGDTSKGTRTVAPVLATMPPCASGTSLPIQATCQIVESYITLTIHAAAPHALSNEHRYLPMQYAYIPVRLPLEEMLDQVTGDKLHTWVPLIPSPRSAVHSARWPFALACRFALRGRVPGWGLTPVSRPHIFRPGDHFHPICANFRSPGPKPARRCASPIGRRSSCH